VRPANETDEENNKPYLVTSCCTVRRRTGTNCEIKTKDEGPAFIFHVYLSCTIDLNSAWYGNASRSRTTGERPSNGSGFPRRVLFSEVVSIALVEASGEVSGSKSQLGQLP